MTYNEIMYRTKRNSIIERERRISETVLWLTFRRRKENARKIKKNLITMIVLEGFNNDKKTTKLDASLENTTSAGRLSHCGAPVLMC